jgi:ribose transport system substrate-binding protein
MDVDSKQRMEEFMGRWKYALVLVGTMSLVATGCGESDNQAVDNQASIDKIVRVPVPESPFAPKDLEATIDNLVSKLSTVKHRAFDISVIFKTSDGTDQAYWAPIRIGAGRAMGELKLGGQVDRPSVALDSDTAVAEQAQIDIINQRVADGYRGIALAPLNTALNDTINAVPDTVPVVTFDNDAPTSKRQLYIGTDQVVAGKTAGATMASLLTQKSGTVFILGTTSTDWTDGYARSFGAKEVLDKAGFTTVVYKVGWGPTEIKNDFDVLTQSIPAADPPTVGCMGMFSNAYRCADIAKQLGYAPEQIMIVAFDFDPTTMQYMKDRYIQATHAQRQYYMGYLVPYALYSITTLGLAATTPLFGKFAIDGHRIDTGVDVVMANQLDAFDAFLDSLKI